MAMRDRYKYLKQDMYLFFGDLVKCFDKLWLKDCLVDLHSAGAREKEVKIIYLLNKLATAKIITPAGMTDEITIHETVKQGTVFAPKLCCCSTGKMNNMSKPAKTNITPGVTVGTLAYVDDMTGGGSKDTISNVMCNCAEIEELKCWEFSTDKSNWMVQRYSGKSRAEDGEKEVRGRVKGGEIHETDVYKLLGNWINNKGNMDKQLQEMEKKISGYVCDCNVIASQHQVGKMEFEAKMLIYEIVIRTSLLYNIEGWSNIRQGDYNRMEVMQGKILKRILGLPDATPYWGVLYEMGIWPVKMVIVYRKIMLFHNLANSDEQSASKDERIAAKLILDQEKFDMPHCWFSEVQNEGQLIGMEVNSKRAKEKKKSEWKRECKQLISKEVTRLESKNIAQMKKLRFLGTKRGRNTYMTETYNNDARRAIRVRLNMEPFIKTNFGMKGSCPLCGLADSTEHILTCDKTDNKDITLEDLMNGRKMKEIANAFERAEEMRSRAITDCVHKEIDEYLNAM